MTILFSKKKKNRGGARISRGPLDKNRKKGELHIHRRDYSDMLPIQVGSTKTYIM